MVACHGHFLAVLYCVQLLAQLPCLPSGQKQLWVAKLGHVPSPLGDGSQFSVVTFFGLLSLQPQFVSTISLGPYVLQFDSLHFVSEVILICKYLSKNHLLF